MRRVLFTGIAALAVVGIVLPMPAAMAAGTTTGADLQLLQRADRRNYEESVPWLRRMRDSGAACGRRSEVEEFVADLRDLHRNRPTFVKILNAAHLNRG